MTDDPLDVTVLEKKIEAEAARLDAADPLDILRWTLSRYGPDTAIAFSGAEDVLLIHLAATTGLPFSVITLDTGRLHRETYQYLEQVRETYGISIDVLFPDTEAVQRLVREKGLFSFYRDGHGECCAIRKVEPLRRGLAGRPAWVTGQRRDQNPETRSHLAVFSLDEAFGSPDAPLVKVNPLAGWTSAQVWERLRADRVPTNPLHHTGFRSIGCEPCTRAVEPGQHEREGRWWWEAAAHKECGLHLPPPDEAG